MMSANNVLSDIEDYDSAYYSRLDDFRIIKNERRKIMAMHLGGVVIECLLKSLIIKKYGITKAKATTSWFDQSAVVKLLELNNPTKAQYNTQKTLDNPGHELQSALRLLEELADIMPIDIESKLKQVFNPLQCRNDRSTYIELRYCTEGRFTDHEFDTWFTNFQDCINWINSQKYKISEVF